ncbi:hypothetical protein AVEN_249558-1 [Araneus ventricosus]|uniref:Uncharacterized protein n=1 Tax=Araneus ventricosus TaxID=182803 RepID=A0A4Y2P7K6_ARAVE|nr:hypothetical protein AVEN_249558-1 [Araneus ventricosus]
MYYATVSHAFNISLIAPEDFCFVVTSSSSDKLFSTTSCFETQCSSISSSVVSSWLCSSTSSSISSLSTSSPLVLNKDTILLTIGSTVLFQIPQSNIRQRFPVKASFNQK